MNKKVIYVLLYSLVAFIFSLCFEACSEQPKATGTVDAKAVFVKRCATCHGSEGNLQMSGAKNITVSQLSADEIKNQIIHGKAGMPPFESMLTVQEIDALSAYCMKLSGR
jgi:mono/diheme cytochrome c family protein